MIKTRKASVASPKGEALKKLFGRVGGLELASVRFRLFSCGVEYSVTMSRIADRYTVFGFAGGDAAEFLTSKTFRASSDTAGL